MVEVSVETVQERECRKRIEMSRAIQRPVTLSGRPLEHASEFGQAAVDFFLAGPK